MPRTIKSVRISEVPTSEEKNMAKLADKYAMKHGHDGIKSPKKVK